MTEYYVSAPFGKADTSVVLSVSGNQNISIRNDLTLIDGTTNSASGARTLILDIESEIKVGAKIILKTKTDGTENTVFGAGFTAPTYAGVAGKTKTQELVFDGTTFKPVAVAFQID